MPASMPLLASIARALTVARPRALSTSAASRARWAVIGQNSTAHRRAAPDCITWLRPVSTTPQLLKVKKQSKKSGKSTSSESSLASDADACGVQLLQEMQHEQTVHRCQSEIAQLQESLYRNLRLQLTPDALHELEVNVDGRRQQLGELADVYKRSDVIVIDLSANKHTITTVKQVLSLKGFAGREQTDSDSIYVSVPRVTHEHRQRLATTGREMLQRTKQTLRRVHDASSKKLKEAERSKRHSADQLRAYHRLLVAQFKAAAAEADHVWAAKERELLA